MAWIFEVFVKGAICKPEKTLTLMTSAIRIRKFIFVGVFFWSDKLFMTEITSVRACNYVGAWYVVTQQKWKYFSIFYTLVPFFFVWENIDDLKFNTFCGRQWPIRLSSHWKSTHEKGTRSRIVFLKSVVLALFVISPQKM